MNLKDIILLTLDIAEKPLTYQQLKARVTYFLYLNQNSEAAKRRGEVKYDS